MKSIVLEVTEPRQQLSPIFEAHNLLSEILTTEFQIHTEYEKW